MRNFESFLTRRKIQDFKSWCSRSGIESFEEFRAYCESQELSFDEKKYAAIFAAPALVEEQTKREQKAPPPAEEEGISSEDESWHIPAAERPIKARGTARKTPAKKPAPKAKAKPRARKTKKD